MPPADVFSVANAKLCEGNEAEMFLTAWMGFLDLKTGEVHVANAGHNPPYILHANGTVDMLKSSCNLVLGAVEDLSFRNDSMQLEPGDAIVMYTDGVTEAENKEHAQFGESRLEAELAGLQGASSKQIVDTVNAKVKEFAGGAAQSDDITQLVIRRK